ncbi:MAG: hypothetical protein RL417_1571, partial [Pseudomonadota bacterium]
MMLPKRRSLGETRRASRRGLTPANVKVEVSPSLESNGGAPALRLAEPAPTGDLKDTIQADAGRQEVAQVSAERSQEAARSNIKNVSGGETSVVSGLPPLPTSEGVSAAPAPTDAQSPTNRQFSSDFVVEKLGFDHLGSPEELSEKLGRVGYQCLPYLAVQISLLLNTPSTKIRALLLEGPSGCGKSFMAKSLAQ